MKENSMPKDPNPTADDKPPRDRPDQADAGSDQKNKTPGKDRSKTDDRFHEDGTPAD
jgi:hypothetical protein